MKINIRKLFEIALVRFHSPTKINRDIYALRFQLYFFVCCSDTSCFECRGIICYEPLQSHAEFWPTPKVSRKKWTEVTRPWLRSRWSCERPWPHRRLEHKGQVLKARQSPPASGCQWEETELLTSQNLTFVCVWLVRHKISETHPRQDEWSKRMAGQGRRRECLMRFWLLRTPNLSLYKFTNLTICMHDLTSEDLSNLFPTT